MEGTELDRRQHFGSVTGSGALLVRGTRPDCGTGYSYFYSLLRV